VTFTQWPASSTILENVDQMSYSKFKFKKFLKDIPLISQDLNERQYNIDHWEIDLLCELFFYDRENLFHAKNILFD
jgi:hypothetical protein